MACNSGTNSVQMGSYNKPENCISNSANTNKPGDYTPGAQEAACGSSCFSGSTSGEEGDNKQENCSCTASCQAGCGPCSANCGPAPSCDSTCSEGCGSGCSGGCDGCRGSCSGCTGDCTGGCTGTCTSKCAEECSGTCSMGCIGFCNHGCTGEEVNKLIENLHLSRIAESDDINTLKKIIFRLFENLKNSAIYNNKNYINEFGDNTIAGLVSNWNEDEDGKMTFTLLLNKTFETIITNLNNLNQNRIDIDQNKINPIKIWTTEIPDPNDFTKTKTIQLNTVDRDAALYWIECLKKIYELVAPIKDKKKE